MSYDHFLPLIDLRTAAAHAAGGTGVRALYSGVGILTLGVLWKCLVQLYRLIRDEKADFVKPFVTYAFFLVVLVNYETLVMTIVRVVTSLGGQNVGGDSIDVTFLRRANAFAAWRASQSWLNVGGLVESTMMQHFAGFLYLLVEALVVLMRATQAFMLIVITTYGPILLGFAALDTFFVPLGVAWFWALIEISAWSVTMGILMQAYAVLGQNIPQEFSVSQEVIYALTMLSLISTVPIITSTLVRGTPGAAMAAGLYVVVSSVQTAATAALGSKAASQGVAAVRGAMSFTPKSPVDKIFEQAQKNVSSAKVSGGGGHQPNKDK